MSKHPTPRLDQLRAMREANFERNAQRQRQEADKPATPDKNAKAKPKAKKKSGR